MSKGLTFAVGDKYLLDGVAYRIEQRLSAATLAVRALASGQLSTVARSALLDAWSAGRLRGHLYGPNVAVDADQPLLQTRYDFLDFQALPVRDQEIARTRHALIEPLLALPTSQRTAAVLATRSAEFPSLGRRGKPVHPGTVWRWLRAFDQSGRDIRALVPGFARRGWHGSHLHPTVRRYLDEAKEEVYLRPERPTVMAVRQAVETKVALHNLEVSSRAQSDDQDGLSRLSAPAWTSVDHYLRALDPWEADTARYGDAHAAREHGQYLAGPRPTRPNERWEFDHTRIPLLVVDDTDWLPIGFPTLTALRDKYTGYPTGLSMSFDPPSYRCVMDCLLYAILPKDHVRRDLGTIHDYLPFGEPELLAIDNAPEFVGRDLDDACLQLGIELMRMPPRKGWFKGAIERWFRTAAQDLFFRVPGTAFANILERGDYRSEEYACMTLNGLWIALHQWIVDDYAQDAHGGIGSPRSKGIPARLWEQALAQGTFTPRLPPARDDLLVLVSRIEERVLQSYGIDFEGMRYQSSELAGIRSRLLREKGDARVRIKYDPGDVGNIWVAHPFERRYVEVKVTSEFRTCATGLSLWTHRVIRRYVRVELRRSVDHVSLALARHRLHTLVQHYVKTGKRLRTRQHAARFLDVRVSELLRGASGASGAGGAGGAGGAVAATEVDVGRVGTEAAPLIGGSAPLALPNPARPVTPDAPLAPFAAALYATTLPPLVEGVALDVADDEPLPTRRDSQSKPTPAQAPPSSPRRRRASAHTAKRTPAGQELAVDDLAIVVELDRPLPGDLLPREE
jgi:putative transposase